MVSKETNEAVTGQMILENSQRHLSLYSGHKEWEQTVVSGLDWRYVGLGDIGRDMRHRGTVDT